MQSSSAGAKRKLEDVKFTLPPAAKKLKPGPDDKASESDIRIAEESKRLYELGQELRQAKEKIKEQDKKQDELMANLAKIIEECKELQKEIQENTVWDIDKNGMLIPVYPKNKDYDARFAAIKSLIAPKSELKSSWEFPHPDLVSKLQNIKKRKIADTDILQRKLKKYREILSDLQKQLHKLNPLYVIPVAPPKQAKKAPVFFAPVATAIETPAVAAIAVTTTEIAPAPQPMEVEEKKSASPQEKVEVVLSMPEPLRKSPAHGETIKVSETKKNELETKTTTSTTDVASQLKLQLSPRSVVYRDSIMNFIEMTLKERQMSSFIVTEHIRQYYKDKLPERFKQHFKNGTKYQPYDYDLVTRLEFLFRLIEDLGEKCGKNSWIHVKLKELENIMQLNTIMECKTRDLVTIYQEKNENVEENRIAALNTFLKAQYADSTIPFAEVKPTKSGHDTASFKAAIKFIRDEFNQQLSPAQRAPAPIDPFYPDADPLPFYSRPIQRQC